MVYYLLFGTILVCSFTIYSNGKRQSKEKDKTFLIFIWLFLSLVEGLRGSSVGTDTAGYIRYFELGFFDNYEFLTQILFILFRRISSNPTFFLTLMALLTNGLIIIAIYRDSVDVKNSIFLFIFMLFYFVSFNAMRQALAYALVLNAYIFAKRKQLIGFLVCMLPSVFFHSSALIGIVYAILFFRKNEVMINETKSIDSAEGTTGSINKKIIWLLVIGVGTIILMKYFMPILYYAVSFFPSYQKYIYGDYAYFSEMAGGITKPIIYTSIFICFLFFACDSKEKDSYLLPLALNVVLAFASYRIAYLERFMYYFDVTTVLSIPFLLQNNIFERKSKSVFRFIVTCLVLFYFVYMFSDNFMRVTNYKFFWS